jgi:hypothetical protein
MDLRPRRKHPSFPVRAALPLLSAVCGGCLFHADAPDPAARHALSYRLEAGDAGCRVTVRIDRWPSGEAKLFQAPVYYPDNPVCPLPGLRAADLDVRDARGASLAARDTALGSAGEGNPIRLPDAARSFAYSVDLDPADSRRFGLPAPGLAPGVDAVDGAYFFVLPILAEDLAARWRSPARLSLDIVAPGRILAGSDAHRDLSTPYELMFLRAVFDPIRSFTRAMPGHDLTVYATSDTVLDLAAFSDRLAEAIRLVEDSLSPLPTYRYFAGETPVFWGVEGIQGYWFHAGAAPDPMVRIHELAHTFVGIYHGDREDPWWKEGMTEYLGWLLPLQAGMVGDTAFAREVLAAHDSVAAVREVALAAPEVRTRLYLPLDSAWASREDPEGFTWLVYGKGGQASMILDRWLLEHSQGRRSVFDLVRALARDYGPAFTRAQLVAETARLSGRPSEAFLSGLLDLPGAFPADSLRATYRALRALGRFGPGGGKAPVPGVDGPPAKRAAPPAADPPFRRGKL